MSNPISEDAMVRISEALEIAQRRAKKEALRALTYKAQSAERGKALALLTVERERDIASMLKRLDALEHASDRVANVLVGTLVPIMLEQGEDADAAQLRAIGTRMLARAHANAPADLHADPLAFTPEVAPVEDM